MGLYSDKVRLSSPYLPVMYASCTGKEKGRKWTKREEKKREEKRRKEKKKGFTARARQECLGYANTERQGDLVVFCDGTLFSKRQVRTALAVRQRSIPIVPRTLLSGCDFVPVHSCLAHTLVSG